MSAPAGVSELQELAAGSHVCWAVADDDAYREWATVLLRGATDLHEKPVLFGPGGSPARDELAPLAAEVADPWTDVLGGGPLRPESMFTMFREQTAVAVAEGYRGLRVVADMDWLLPAGATTADIVGFEAVLDRHARALHATIVCAYRTASFDTTTIHGASCVHPTHVGGDDRPQFRLVAADDGSWHVTGDLDIAAVGDFEAALAAISETSGCVLDASGLAFIDVANMRALAQAAQRSGGPILVVATPTLLRRSWQLAGFDAVAPSVELAA